MTPRPRSTATSRPRAGGTRVDLRAPRPPAETPRAELRRLATEMIVRLHGSAGRGVEAIVRIANGLIAALAAADRAEREARFQAGRVEFTEVAMQRTIDDLRADLEEARASIKLLSFGDEPTKNEPDDFEVATGVRPSGGG